MNSGLAENVPHELSRYAVGQLPPTVYYVPCFITESEESYLMRKIYDAPKPKWTELLNRRLQNWGLILGARYASNFWKALFDTSGIPHEKGMIPDTIPEWLQIYCDKVEKLGIFKNCKPNHILINEYVPGQGIMPHTDGPLYYPTVANITLGSHAVLEWYHPIDRTETDTDPPDKKDTSLESRNFARILLERRSLLVVQGDMYSKYLHGISETKRDVTDNKVANLSQCEGRQVGDELVRDTRLSLTIRNVPKVMKGKFLLGKKR